MILRIKRNNSFLWFCIAILIVGIFEKTYAQYQQLFFDRISAKEGLSQSTVNCILQDHNGYLWFATFDGLNRYDGYSFKVYLHDGKDHNSISSNSIIYIYEDSKGYIWAVNNRDVGLDRFDPITEKFEHFVHDPNDTNSISGHDIFHIMEDSKGNIWICTSNYLNRFVDPGSGNNSKVWFEKYKIPESSYQLTRAFENKFGEIYVFSDYVNYLDQENKKIINTGVQIGTSSVISVIEYETNDLLLGTNQDGIIKLEYNTLTKGYKRTDPGKINLTPNNRTCLYLDHNQHLWIGTELSGLYRYRPEKDILEQYLPDDFEERSISDRTIYSLYKDNTGVLWIGTFSQGLCKYDFYGKKFMHFYRIPYKDNSLSGDVISSIHGIKPDELWVGLDVGGGVNRILFSENNEPKIIHYLHDPKNPNSIRSNSTLCLVQRKNGNVWIGSASGYISRIKPEVPFSGREPEIKSYEYRRWTFSIFEDSDGILWGGTWGNGLWRYDDKTDSFDFFMPDTTKEFSIHDDIIWSLGEDKYKNIWIGGHGEGIDILTADEKKKKSPKFLHFEFDETKSGSISDNTINAIYQAKDGTQWICTGQGLNKTVNHNELTGRFQDFPEIIFKSYHVEDGLPAEGIIGIVEDNKSNIWTSTVFGISRMDPVSEEFTNYNEDHGLQSNEFWHNAYFRNSKDMIFFGGKKGFNAFYPDQIKPNPFLPHVLLTELKLFNKVVNVGDTINNQIVLSQAIHETDELVLSHKNNIITLEFAALHYAQPSQNRYAYYLEGFENEWNTSENQRSATYTNLNPGSYTFRIKATNNDGIWSKKEIALRITVLPPWWKSLFIKISLPIVLLLIILIIFRIRLRILQQQKKRLQKTVDARTEELQEINTLLEEKQEEILIQNEELQKHRNNLEEMVDERTQQLEKAKLKAEESDRLKSSFLANMSHEIRTPMNAIMGFSSLLMKDECDEEEKNRFLQTINANGESLLVLINDILDISMIESNQMDINPSYFNVNEVLNELEEFCIINNDNKLNIEFVNKNDEDLILFLDPVRFRQIMNNLLGNALKYTDKGYVKFGYTKKEDEICFYVSDSGIGIDPKYKESIFEHFYKIDLETSTIYRGTGIGLAICKKLVDLLKGKIWVESDLGKGSSFYFTLPYQYSNQINIEDKSKPKTNHNFLFDNIFFVIAEDDKTNYELLVNMLHISEEKHFWGKNGNEVVEFIESMNNYNNMIVLMDIKMPGMNGVEAMQKIKKLNKNIPVIAVTAFALKHEEKGFMSKDFDGFIAKPIQEANLIKTISRFFKKAPEK